MTEHKKTETELPAPVGTVKELFTQAAWERLDVKGSTKVYLGTPPAAPVPHEQGKATTYTERFAHAVAILCGAQPPADMVAEWIANIDVNGEHRLQSWVLCQAATPSWAQGIVVLDAAHVLANDPEEGAGHEERPPVVAVPKAYTTRDWFNDLENPHGNR